MRRVLKSSLSMLLFWAGERKLIPLVPCPWIGGDLLIMRNLVLALGSCPADASIGYRCRDFLHRSRLGTWLLIPDVTVCILRDGLDGRFGELGVD